MDYKKLNSLTKEIISIDRSLEDLTLQGLYSYDYEQEILMDWHLCENGYPAVDVIEDTITMFKDAFENNDQTILRYNKSLIVDTSITVMIEERREPEPWEDWDNDVYYLVVRGDIKESEEDFKKRKENIQKEIDLLNGKKLVLLRQLETEK